MTRKIIDIVTAILFLVFAYFQINDPDSWWWILVYVLVAIIPILSLFNKLNKRRILSTLIVFGLLLIIYSSNLITWLNAGLPDIIHYENDNMDVVEGIREYFGLAISFIVVLMYYLFHPKSKPKSS